MSLLNAVLESTFPPPSSDNIWYTYIGAGIMCKSEIVPEISYGDKGEVASAEESGGEKVPEKVLTDKSNEEEEVLEKPPQPQEQN
jgi:hypothetical protein